MEGIVGAIGGTPLVRMRQLLPTTRIDLWAKLESQNPGGSSKARPAARMIVDALRTGELAPGHTVIESSSGNMAIGLAQVCRFYGLQLICVLDSRTNESTVRTLHALGVDVRVITEPDPETGELLTARLNEVAMLAERTPNSFCPDQYANPANPAAHADGTMREIDEALEGHLDYLLVAAGTVGTLLGCANYLREHGRGTRLIAVDAEGSALFGGEPGARRLPGHGAGVESAHSRSLEYDQLVRVSDLECVIGCRRLLEREAIFAGASSGAVVFALQKIVSSFESGARCAVVLPDGGAGYLDTVYDDAWVERETGCSTAALTSAIAELPREKA